MMLSYVSICPPGPIYHSCHPFAALAINILCRMVPGMEEIAVVRVVSTISYKKRIKRATFAELKFYILV